MPPKAPLQDASLKAKGLVGPRKLPSRHQDATASPTPATTSSADRPKVTHRAPPPTSRPPSKGSSSSLAGSGRTPPSAVPSRPNTPMTEVGRGEVEGGKGRTTAGEEGEEGEINMSSRRSRSELGSIRSELEKNLVREREEAASGKKQGGGGGNAVSPPPPPPSPLHHSPPPSSPPSSPIARKKMVSDPSRSIPQSNALPTRPTTAAGKKLLAPPTAAAAEEVTPAALPPKGGKRDHLIPIKGMILAAIDDDDDDDDFFSGGSEGENISPFQRGAGATQPQSHVVGVNTRPILRVAPPQSSSVLRTKRMSSFVKPASKGAASSSLQPGEPLGQAHTSGCNNDEGSPHPRPVPVRSQQLVVVPTKSQSVASPTLSPLSTAGSPTTPSPRAKASGKMVPPMRRASSTVSFSSSPTGSQTGSLRRSSGMYSPLGPGRKKPLAPPPATATHSPKFTIPRKVESLNHHPDWQLRPSSPRPEATGGRSSVVQDGGGKRGVSAAFPGAVDNKPDMEFSFDPLEDIISVEHRQLEEKRLAWSLRGGDDLLPRPTITTKKIDLLSQPKRRVTPKSKRPDLTEEEREWEEKQTHLSGHGIEQGSDSEMWATQHHGGTPSDGNVYMYTAASTSQGGGTATSKAIPNTMPPPTVFSPAANKTSRCPRHGGKVGGGSSIFHPSDYCFIRVRMLGRTDEAIEGMVPRVALAKNMLLASIAADLNLPMGGSGWHYQYRGLPVHPHATPATLGLRSGPEHVTALTLVSPIETSEEVARGRLFNDQVGSWCNALASLYTLIIGATHTTLPTHTFIEASHRYSDASEVAAARDARRNVDLRHHEDEEVESGEDAPLVGEWADEVKQFIAPLQHHHKPKVSGVVIESRKVGYPQVSGLTVEEATLQQEGNLSEVERLNQLRQYGYTDLSHAGDSKSLLPGRDRRQQKMKSRPEDSGLVCRANEDKENKGGGKQQHQHQPQHVRGQEGSFGLDALAALRHAKGARDLRKSKMDYARSKWKDEWQHRFGLGGGNSSRGRPVSPVTDAGAVRQVESCGAGESGPERPTSAGNTQHRHLQPHVSSSHHYLQRPQTVHVYDSDPMLYSPEEVVLWDDAEVDEVFDV